jgi:hypothetical protein
MPPASALSGRAETAGHFRSDYDSFAVKAPDPDNIELVEVELSLSPRASSYQGKHLPRDLSADTPASPSASFSYNDSNTSTNVIRFSTVFAPLRTPVGAIESSRSEVTIFGRPNSS